MSDASPPLNIPQLLQGLSHWRWRSHRVLPYIPMEDFGAYYAHIAKLYGECGRGDKSWLVDRVIEIVEDVLDQTSRTCSEEFTVNLGLAIHLLFENGASKINSQLNEASFDLRAFISTASASKFFGQLNSLWNKRRSVDQRFCVSRQLNH